LVRAAPMRSDTDSKNYWPIPDSLVKEHEPPTRCHAPAGRVLWKRSRQALGKTKRQPGSLINATPSSNALLLRAFQRAERGRMR